MPPSKTPAVVVVSLSEEGLTQHLEAHEAYRIGKGMIFDSQGQPTREGLNDMPRCSDGELNGTKLYNINETALIELIKNTFPPGSLLIPVMTGVVGQYCEGFVTRVVTNQIVVNPGLIEYYTKHTKTNQYRPYAEGSPSRKQNYPIFTQHFITPNEKQIRMTTSSAHITRTCLLTYRAAKIGDAQILLVLKGNKKYTKISEEEYTSWVKDNSLADRTEILFQAFHEMQIVQGVTHRNQSAVFMRYTRMHIAVSAQFLSLIAFRHANEEIEIEKKPSADVSQPSVLPRTYTNSYETSVKAIEGVYQANAESVSFDELGENQRKIFDRAGSHFLVHSIAEHVPLLDAMSKADDSIRRLKKKRELIALLTLHRWPILWEIGDPQAHISLAESTKILQKNLMGLLLQDKPKLHNELARIVRLRSVVNDEILRIGDLLKDTQRSDATFKTRDSDQTVQADVNDSHQELTIPQLRVAIGLLLVSPTQNLSANTNRLYEHLAATGINGSPFFEYQPETLTLAALVHMSLFETADKKDKTAPDVETQYQIYRLSDNHLLTAPCIITQKGSKRFKLDGINRLLYSLKYVFESSLNEVMTVIIPLVIMDNSAEQKIRTVASLEFKMHPVTLADTVTAAETEPLPPTVLLSEDPATPNTVDQVAGAAASEAHVTDPDKIIIKMPFAFMPIVLFSEDVNSGEPIWAKRICENIQRLFPRERKLDWRKIPFEDSGFQLTAALMEMLVTRFQRRRASDTTRPKTVQECRTIQAEILNYLQRIDSISEREFGVFCDDQIIPLLSKNVLCGPSNMRYLLQNRDELDKLIRKAKELSDGIKRINQQVDSLWLKIHADAENTVRVATSQTKIEALTRQNMELRQELQLFKAKLYHAEKPYSSRESESYPRSGGFFDSEGGTAANSRGLSYHKPAKAKPQTERYSEDFGPDDINLSDMNEFSCN